MNDAKLLLQWAELRQMQVQHPRRQLQQRGFTYLGLIILITIIGLVAVSSIQLGAIVQRRAVETELLGIGKEFYDAFLSYAAATPQGQSPFPNRVEDLLVDPRFPGLKRHLRKLYIDPLTGNNEWGVVMGASAAGKGIIGLYSLSDAKPIKVDGFEPPFQQFKGKKSYHDWVFSSQMQLEFSPETAQSPDSVTPEQTPSNKPPANPHQTPAPRHN